MDKAINLDSNVFRLGIDVGSTTVKLAVLDSEDNLIYNDYLRHYADLWATLIKLFKDLYKTVGNIKIKASVTGSGGIAISERLDLPFVQEVIAGCSAAKRYIPDVNVIIELGGEDAKLTFFDNGTDQRMNGICAGGTGAFIDQMAILLKTDAAGLNELAKKSAIIYPIAARCGVFAKTDIQALLNEGAKKENIAASVFQAVVNQTIGGLASGRKIKGKVGFLGGPLHFLPELRRRFRETLNLQESDIFIPENAQVFVAIGAALCAEKGSTLLQLIDCFEKKPLKNESAEDRLEPLFSDKKEYNRFIEKHSQHTVKKTNLDGYSGECFLGLDI